MSYITVLKDTTSADCNSMRQSKAIVVTARATLTSYKALAPHILRMEGQSTVSVTYAE
jgi:hypothetical protein